MLRNMQGIDIHVIAERAQGRRKIDDPDAHP
jgi:hypothetical protein